MTFMLEMIGTCVVENHIMRVVLFGLTDEPDSSNFEDLQKRVTLMILASAAHNTFFMVCHGVLKYKWEDLGIDILENKIRIVGL